METYRRLEDLVVNYIDFVGAQFSEPDIELPQPVGGYATEVDTQIPVNPVKRSPCRTDATAIRPFPSVLSFGP